MEEKRSNLVLKFYRWRYIVIFPGQNKLVCYFAGWGRLTDRPLARQMVTIETAEIVKLTQSIFSLQYLQIICRFLLKYTPFLFEPDRSTFYKKNIAPPCQS